MLTERQKQILWAIIDEYIASAEPVGSRTISKKEGIGFSAATIRNEMADLKEMGFLEQPHTSAGRIPSQKGYRFYVDHLLTPYMWSSAELRMASDQEAWKLDPVEQAIQHTTSILSQLTNYMTFVVSPSLVENKLRHLQIVPLFERSAVSILVTDTGRVYQQRLQLPERISIADLERLVNLLNHRLIGAPLSKLKQIAIHDLTSELVHHVAELEVLSSLLDQILNTERGERLYTSGTTRILNQPEFQDVEKMKSILNLVEENETMIRLLEPDVEGVQVRIGYENHVEAVSHCTIISASYKVKGDPVGAIGVLGPVRMEYGKVISLIDFLAKDFTHRLGILDD